MPIHVKVKDEADLERIAKDLLRILVNLRHHTKRWEEDHGVVAKTSKKSWEAKADQYLAKLTAFIPEESRNEQIIIDKEEQ